MKETNKQVNQITEETKMKNLIKQFEQIATEEESKRDGLDSSYIVVKFPKSKWREAKKAGAKRDCYYGWILWETSVNTGATRIVNRVRSIAQPLGLITRERQL